MLVSCKKSNYCIPHNPSVLTRRSSFFCKSLSWALVLETGLLVFHIVQKFISSVVVSNPQGFHKGSNCFCSISNAAMDGVMCKTLKFEIFFCWRVKHTTEWSDSKIKVTRVPASDTNVFPFMFFNGKMFRCKKLSHLGKKSVERIIFCKHTKVFHTKKFFNKIFVGQKSFSK